MRSIQRRLSFSLVIVLLTTGLLLAQTSLWLFDLGLRRYLESSLREEAEGLLAALVRSPTGIQLDQQHLPSGYQRPYSGHYFRIDFSMQNWRSRSLWDYPMVSPEENGLQADLEDGPEAQKLLVYRINYRRFGENISITVAEDYSPILKTYRQMQWAGSLLGTTTLILLLLLQRFMVRRALSPLEEVRQQVIQLQKGQRKELDGQVPLELEPLVGQINHLLHQTEITLQRSRHAIGNLGHALKTPLAVLISLAQRDELSLIPELRNVLREQLESIEQRLSRELARARIAGEVTPLHYFDCDAELPSLFDTLKMVHNRNLVLDWNVPKGLRLPWDREDVLELFGNLLDNACKWARSKVRLQISIESDRLLIWVDDDGPGVAAESRAEVLGRGIRLDEQVAGHGLGLAIVRDILDAWKGALELQDSPWGGLRVALKLPMRPVA